MSNFTICNRKWITFQFSFPFLFISICENKNILHLKRELPYIPDWALPDFYLLSQKSVFDSAINRRIPYASLPTRSLAQTSCTHKYFHRSSTARRSEPIWKPQQNHKEIINWKPVVFSSHIFLEDRKRPFPVFSFHLKRYAQQKYCTKGLGASSSWLVYISAVGRLFKVFKVLNEFQKAWQNKKDKVQPKQASEIPQNT